MTGPTSPAVSLDQAVMRVCAERLPLQGAEEPFAGEGDRLTLRLRGHVVVIVREVELVALALPET